MENNSHVEFFYIATLCYDKNDQEPLQIVIAIVICQRIIQPFSVIMSLLQKAAWR